MTTKLTDAERALLAACRTARVQLRRNRLAVIRAYSMPPGSLNPESITDKAAKVWLREHDRALLKLDNAIKKTASSQS